MPKNFLTLTLSELLGHPNPTVYRNSMSILKTLQRITDEIDEYNNEQEELLEKQTSAFCDNKDCPLKIPHTKNHCNI